MLVYISDQGKRRLIFQPFIVITVKKDTTSTIDASNPAILLVGLLLRFKILRIRATLNLQSLFR